MAIETAPEDNHPRSPAWGVLVTLLLGLPLISPLIRWTAVACTHDGHLHYHRIAAMGEAWANGVYFSRWLSDLAFGYGYPFFIYREAAPLYLPFIGRLAGLPVPAASNLFYALTILAAGVFMFLWVRDLFGERAGVVSAMAYMAAPYVLIDALVRGNSPESLALPLFPLLLWAGRRWVLYGGVGSFLTAVLGLALLSLSHNISTLIFAPTLLVYLAAVAWVRTDQRADEARNGWQSIIGRPLARVGLLLVLGLGIAFFYTGGALLELDQVTLEQSTTTRNNDWRYNFASLGEILAPVSAEDPTLVNPPLLFRLGWVPLALALLGTTGLLWLKGSEPRVREQRTHIVLMLAGALLFVAMALPLSRPLWNGLPLIEFVQFPWRFVGRAALPVAFLAGVPFAHPVFASGRQWLKLAIPLAAVLLIFEALPNLYPRYCTEESYPTIQTVHEYEHITGLVGVDPEGSYFPRTVEQRPQGSPLEADYQAGRSPQRFDTTVLPPGATIEDAIYTPFSVSLIVQSPEPFLARYLSFDFPGWVAEVDGHSVPITPEDPSGLITFEVPAGSHTVEVGWTATPQRWALTIASLLALGATAILAFWSWRQSPVKRDTIPAWLTRPELWALAITAVVLLLFKLAVVDRQETVWRRPSRPPVATSAGIDGGELQLAGYSTSRAAAGSGETFDIDLAWRALAPPSVDYQSRVWLEGPGGLVWSEKGTERPRVYEEAAPTRLWKPGEWGWDSQEVTVLGGTPPGTYDVVVTLFDKATLQPLTLRDETSGEVLGPEAVIGQIEVIASDQPMPIAPQTAFDEDISTLGLRLLGANQDRQTAASGETVLLTLFWERLEGTAAEQFTVLLEDENGESAASWELPLSRTDFSTEGWQAGDQHRGQYWLPLPAGVAGGDYRLVLEDTIDIGRLQVEAPNRLTTEPPLAMRLDVNFSTPEGITVATLTGQSAESNVIPACALPMPEAAECSVSLVWQAQSETPVDYHVFVHLLDAEGNLLAQSDGVPANWTRPAAGWLPGEYIVDNHLLSLPTTLPLEGLTLRAGLYDPDTGERLVTLTGDHAVLLP